jgi:H+-translocating NAD(P) transhydrogenase
MGTDDKRFEVNLEDEVVRRSIVVHKGEMLWPAPVPPPPPAPASPTVTAPVQEVVAITPYKKAVTEVGFLTGGLGGIFGIGALTSPLFMSNIFTLGLASLIGYRAVWGVAPALHSPLVSPGGQRLSWTNRTSL